MSADNNGTDGAGRGESRAPRSPHQRGAAAERAMGRRLRREAKERRLTKGKDPAPQPPPTRPKPTRTTSTTRRTQPDRPTDRPTGRSADRPTRPRRSIRPTRASRPVRPTRRRVLIRRWVAVSVLLGLIGLVVVVLYTPLLGVRSVQVVGEQSLTADEVRVAAAVPSGTPMLRLNIEAIEARVSTLPKVFAVDVSRQWPGTVVITVTERSPVGMVVGPGGVHLVDANGVDYNTLAAPPPGLPKIQLTKIDPSDPTTQAVVHVLAALPAQLRAEVATVSAQTPGSVTLGLSSGKTVRWGSADDSARKSAVLAALMTQPGKIYDVSSPDLPTIS